MQRWFSTADITMRSRKTEIYGGLRGCIQKVIHFMHKVIPRYPVESPVDKVDSQFLRQVFTVVSCGAGVTSNLWLGELRRLRRGNKRVDTCGFYPLDSRFPLFVSLVKIGERRPLRKGERQRIFSSAWTRVARHVSTYSQGRIHFCYIGGLLSAGCGITVPHDSLASCDRQGLRKINYTKR